MKGLKFSVPKQSKNDHTYDPCNLTRMESMDFLIFVLVKLLKETLEIFFCFRCSFYNVMQKLSVLRHYLKYIRLQGFR